MEMINFVLCYDHNLKKEGIKLISDIVCLHSNNRLTNVYVIHHDLEPTYFVEIDNYLSNVKNLKNYNIISYYVKKNELSTYSTGYYITPTTNYRYHIWKLGLENTNIIYLDIDVQIKKPLFKYYDMNLSDYTTASCYDHACSIYNRFKCFSTGCMIINLKSKSVNNMIFNELLKFHAKYPKETNADQFVLCNVLKNTHLFLDNDFELNLSNYLQCDSFRRINNIIKDDSIIEYLNTLDKDLDYYSIIHYSIPKKPYNCTNYEINYKLNKIFDEYKEICI